MAKRLTAWEAKMRRQIYAASLEADLWNLKHRVGTSVTLRKDSGETISTKTRSDAYVCESGYAVCFFDGVSGYYLLSRAQPLPDPPVQP